MRRRLLKHAVWFAASLATMVFGSRAIAAPSVWAMDDGERIHQDDTSSSLKQGTDNAVWSPGGTIELYGLRGETVAFQVVVEADAAPLSDVTVSLDRLTGPGGISIMNLPDATDPTDFIGRRIELFVEHFFNVGRSSGGPWGSLGGIDAGAMTGLVPDALIPIEVAPSWSPYPMEIAANMNGVVWVDISIPKTIAAGMYTGEVIVGGSTGELARLPISLAVDGHTMPAFPIKTMLFYSKGKMASRMGSASADAAERHLWKLYHRHHISPMHSAMNTSQLASSTGALDGSFYTAANNYQGIGEEQGDGVLSLGTYGAYGPPDTNDLAQVEAIADDLAAKGLLDTIDVFVYAIDESCGSSYGQEWVNLIAGSSNQNVKDVRVGWTCSSQPVSQPVDIVMTASNHYAPSDVPPAEAAGKQVWIYNGYQPYTGAFMTDHDTVGTRVNGWIAAIHDIERWFYWESTFWYDNNNGGWGAFDPFVTAETFHNQHGEWAQGDGLLVYPGRQVDQYTEHSIGMDGVIASIRLKNWRRGIQDAGYYQLARTIEPEETEAIGRTLIPRSVSEAQDTWATAWTTNGAAFFNARKQLWDILAATSPPIEPPPDDTDPPPVDTEPSPVDTEPPPVDEDTGEPPDTSKGDQKADEAETTAKNGCGCAVPGAQAQAAERRLSLLSLIKLLF